MKTQKPPATQQRKRLVNRRTQGDLGEFSAMEWLASKGALVWVPLGHSPDVDLLAQIDDQIHRVQVKSSTYRLTTPDGHSRWAVSLSTNGGNQSWSGMTKTFDPSCVDYLFALVGDGRRWFIPAGIVEATRRLNLGGTKYSEFEVECGQPIEHLVYSDGNIDELDQVLGECLSGQKDQTVNLAAMPTQVRILSPPFTSLRSGRGTKVLGDKTQSERRLGRSGHALLRQKRQITISKAPVLRPASGSGIACELEQTAQAVSSSSA